MSLIAWIVPGLGAGLPANLSAASTRAGRRYEVKRNDHGAFSAYGG